MNPQLAVDLVAEARRNADAAAARAGVRIEPAHDLEQLSAVLAVINAVWQPNRDAAPVTLGVLRAMTHAGNYCTLAWDGVEPVGVCLGFLGIADGLTLHSHIAGVTSAAAGRNVGRALKLDQRAWALERGVEVVTWTYDPLIRRNAYFNAARLGALPTEYLVDFYGDMDDAINAGQHTDRLAVSWLLAAPTVVDICAGRSPAAVAPEAASRLVLDVAEVTQEPVLFAGAASDTARRVRIPTDIESMRHADRGLARRWRLAVRDVLGELMATGWSVRSVTRQGHYQLERNGEVVR